MDKQRIVAVDYGSHPLYGKGERISDPHKGLVIVGLPGSERVSSQARDGDTTVKRPNQYWQEGWMVLDLALTRCGVCPMEGYRELSCL